jgi:hypothetical protein
MEEHQGANKSNVQCPEMEGADHFTMTDAPQAEGIDIPVQQHGRPEASPV